jgi:hypothetical protein
MHLGTLRREMHVIDSVSIQPADSCLINALIIDMEMEIKVNISVFSVSHPPLVIQPALHHVP